MDFKSIASANSATAPTQNQLYSKMKNLQGKLGIFLKIQNKSLTPQVQNSAEISAEKKPK
jgi:hypothetical protein